MPCGLVRSGDYRKGDPITLPHVFGTSVNSYEPFGNDVTLPKNFGNPITLPMNFGNIIGGGTSGFELEDNSGVIVLEDGTSVLLLEAQ